MSYLPRRQVGQVVILVPMIAVALADAGIFTVLIGVMLVPLAVFQWAVWVYLRSKLRLAEELGFSLPTLNDRVEDALTHALASTAGAFAGMLVILRGAQLIGTVPRELYLVIIAYVLIIITVPALGWLDNWRQVWLPSLRRQRAEDIPEPPVPTLDGPGRPLGEMGGGASADPEDAQP